MPTARIRILSSDGTLAGQIQKRLAHVEISNDDREVDFVVIDGSRASAHPRAQAPARIILLTGEDQTSVARKPGDLILDRNLFLAGPEPFVEAARDFARLARHALTLETELDFSRQIHDLLAVADLESVFEKITRTVLDLLHLPFGTLLLHDTKLERYVASYSNDPHHEDTGEYLPGISEELVRNSFDAARSFAVRPATEQEKGILVLPIRLGDDLIGVVKIPTTPGTTVDPVAAADASRYIQSIGSVLGSIYQITRSNDLAMRDDLTRAYNRRFFESYLDEEIERSRRYGSLLSVIFLDLDELKLVNNKYGHLMGSRTLQEVAKRILHAVRTIDKVIRFGGDEFCIILPQTDPEQAKLVAARVRKALIESPFRPEPNVEIPIRASFGIASYPIHALTKEDLVQQADGAMYLVKSTTKDSILVSSSSPSAPLAAREESILKP